MDKESVSFSVLTPGREIDRPVVAYLFDKQGALVARTAVREGSVTFELSPDQVLSGRLLLGLDQGEDATMRSVERSGAFEPLIGVVELPEIVEIPPIIVDRWPFCLCLVKGRVVRSDGRPVCQARVHICEVDRIPLLIAKLPPEYVLRIRDDLIEQLRKRVPKPLPRPPFPPDPVPDLTPVFRFADYEPENLGISDEEAISQPMFARSLHSESVPIVRNALIENYRLLIPYICLWPWWWGWFACDEVLVLETDGAGRFQGLFSYDCDDQPDLYFWVEYDLGAGFETVHKPLIACNTHWNYACGSDVTVTINDPRVPACDGEVDLPGCQVNVLSIGRNVAIREVDPASGVLTVSGAPFAGTLEPRVDFSRTTLIDVKNIPYYRWSYRRLTGPDGVTPQTGSWTVMNETVVRHYKEVIGTSTHYPAYLLGPLPTSESPPAANLFRIRPATSPSGDEWRVLNERVDLATAYFKTADLASAPVTQTVPDDGAGLYELKLELFDTAGDLVDWGAAGITLNITDQNAPFGIGLVTASEAPEHNKLRDGSGNHIGFRMVIRADNNRCSGTIHPVTGDITPDPSCGFHEYDSNGDHVSLSFDATHPNGFARFVFSVVRGSTTGVAAAGTSGRVGGPGNNGYGLPAGDTYSKTLSVGSLVGPCPSAAFGERLHTAAMAQDGYSRFHSYDDHDIAGFALTPS